MNLGWVFLGFGTLLTVAIAIPCILLLSANLFPQASERAAERLTQHPARSFGIGLLLTLPTGLLIAVLMQAAGGMVQLFGWALLLGLLAVASIGASGLASMLGRRMTPHATPSAALIRGAVVLECSAILPLLGWFVATPLLIIWSVGAGLPTLRRTARPIAPPAEVHHATPTP